MNANLTIHPTQALNEVLEPEVLPVFSKMSISYAQAKLTTLKNGFLLRQSFSHYLACIEVFEYSLEKDTAVNFSLEGNAICMVIVLNGHAKTLDHFNFPLSESKGTCCYLSQQNAGNYYTMLKAGEHRMLMLTLRPEWLLQHAAAFPEFKSIIENYQIPKAGIHYLPKCPVSKDMSKAIEKLEMQNSEDLITFNRHIYESLYEIVSSYHKMLVGERYLNIINQQQKAEELDTFIKENFHSKYVEDLAFLADKFLLSKRNLQRFAREAFGMPLHRYVIYTRMYEAIDLVLTTAEPINKIAQSVGYQDTHYFSRAFKKFFEVSPQQIIRYKQ